MKKRYLPLIIAIFTSYGYSKTIHYKLDYKSRTGQRIIKQDAKEKSHLRNTIIKEIKQNREDINRLNEAVAILIIKDSKKSYKKHSKKKTKKKEKKK